MKHTKLGSINHGDAAASEGDELRFSDPMLIKFHNEFLTLRQSFEAHAADEKECMQQMMFTQVENTAAILRTNEMLVEQKNDTKELIQLFKDGQSVIRVGSIIGRFAKWLLGLSVLGVAFKWLADLQ